MWLLGIESRNTAESEKSKDSPTTGWYSQLSSGIQETRNDNSEDLHNDRKIKVLSNSFKHEEEGHDHEQDGNAILQVMWKHQMVWSIREYMRVYVCDVSDYYPSGYG